MMLKKIFSIFLIFNLITVSTAQAASTTATTFVHSKNVQSEDELPTGLVFNNDGTKMFVVGTVGDYVHEYTLTTGFDVSTATFVDDSFEVTEDTAPLGIAFNNDGTKLFVAGNQNDSVYEYTLTTGFDVSTATFVDSLDLDASGREDDPRDIAFNNDGTKLFVVGNENDNVYEYTLTTGFDVSTATFLDSFAVTQASTTSPAGLAFNDDGSKMFVTALIENDVNEYNLSCAFKVTSSSKCDAPSKIKEVVGLIEAQIETVKNFAKKSSGTALKRLSQLRIKQKDDLTSQNIDINFSNPALAQLAGLVPRSASAKLNPLQQMVPEDWAAWSEGSVSFGKIEETNLSSAQDNIALGISLGADKKIDDNKILGVALRLGNNDVDVGTYGSSVDTNAISLSLYGSNTLDENKFIDHVIGVSHLRSDIVRKNSGDTNTQTGDRKGNQAFGSLKFVRESEYNDMNIAPSGRIDCSYTVLDGYTESGNEAIKYDDQNISSLMASLGLMIDRDINLEKSIVKSRVNLEYGKDFASTSKVVTRYTSDLSTTDTINANTKNRDILTGGLGFDFTHEQGLTVSADYERQQIINSGHIDTLSLTASFLSKKETEFALALNGDTTSNFKISKALGIFDLGFNLENDFSNQGYHNANLSISSQF